MNRSRVSVGNEHKTYYCYLKKNIKLKKVSIKTVIPNDQVFKPRIRLLLSLFIT